MELRVFEIANRSRREVYVAATALPTESILDFFASKPPELLNHWRFASENIAVFEIEAGVSDIEVPNLVSAYDRATPMPGWTVMHAWRSSPRKT
jgi:hypothetical protein